MKSIIIETGRAVFPDFMAERVYMREFYKDKGLPDDLVRWQSTVDSMLSGIDTDGPIYIMIDEARISAGVTHRRKGLHVDGYWNPGLSAHGNTSGHGSVPSGHGGNGGSHRSVPSGHNGGGGSHGATDHIWIDRFTKVTPKRKPLKKKTSSWQDSTFEEPEAIILCSSLSAARGYLGEFTGPVGEGGDCSHIDLGGLTELPMVANTVYAGNVCCLHESVPVTEDSFRQLVRLNVPGWSPMQ